MLNHSNNELPAITIIFTSHDFDHVIYIFICNMKLRDPAASMKHKINLVWPYNHAVESSVRIFVDLEIKLKLRFLITYINHEHQSSYVIPY